MTSNEEIKFFFLNLTNQSRAIQFTVLALSVLTFNVIQGYLSELIFKNVKYKEITLFFVLIQWGFYSLFSFIQLFISENLSLRKATSLR